MHGSHVRVNCQAIATSSTKKAVSIKRQNHEGLFGRMECVVTGDDPEVVYTWKYIFMGAAVHAGRHAMSIYLVFLKTYIVAPPSWYILPGNATQALRENSSGIHVELRFCYSGVSRAITPCHHTLEESTIRTRCMAQV